MEEIPKDLKRWLKDNGHFTEFIRLIRVCGYSVDNLSYTYEGYNGKKEYGIKNWFKSPIESRHVQFINSKDKKTINYTDFLSNLRLNWNKK
jgi:hypothetical protein